MQTQNQALGPNQLMLNGNIPVAATSDWQEQWKQIRALQAQIEEGHDPNAVYIVSQSIPSRGIVGGRVFEVNSEDAAKNVYFGTHRMADPQEIKAYEMNQIAKKNAISKDEADRRERLGNITARDLAEGVIAMTRAAAPAEQVAASSPKAKSNKAAKPEGDAAKSEAASK